jgi:predicted lipid-binding transport protein (Tim44 family)
MGEGFQFLEIVFFAMVAVFIILRLRNVLGRRTGNEPPPAKPVLRSRSDSDDENNVVALPDRAGDGDAPAGEQGSAPADEVVAAGLNEIAAADRSFELRTFLPGARTAYDMILNSFAGGDTDTLRELLDDEVFASFEHAIRDRESRGETLETRVAGVKSTDVVEARTRGRLAEITVKFVSEIVNVTRDSDNKVISGDERSAQSLTDYWTFVRDTRAGDPNWKLVATRSEN